MKTNYDTPQVEILEITSEYLICTASAEYHGFNTGAGDDEEQEW